MHGLQLHGAGFDRKGLGNHFIKAAHQQTSFHTHTLATAEPTATEISADCDRKGVIESARLPYQLCNATQIQKKTWLTAMHVFWLSLDFASCTLHSIFAPPQDPIMPCWLASPIQQSSGFHKAQTLVKSHAGQPDKCRTLVMALHPTVCEKAHTRLKQRQLGTTRDCLRASSVQKAAQLQHQQDTNACCGSRTRPHLLPSPWTLLDHQQLASAHYKTCAQSWQRSCVTQQFLHSCRG